jgi:exodeoxyribonuclease V alpha subunit
VNTEPSDFLPSQVARTLCEVWPVGASSRVAGLIARVVEAAAQGHTWVAVEAGSADSDALRTWSGTGGPDADLLPLIVEDGRVALRRWWRLEQRVAAALLRLATAASAPAPALSVRVDIADPAQRAAVVQALASPVSLVFGGPGTGKTWTVAQILRGWLLAGVEPLPRIALAAPTGKAAARLTESINQTLGSLAESLPRARTLHGLLGASRDGARWRHHAAAPLPIDVLVVDEVSMIDLDLMTRLLEALAPGTRLVLLGDPDQLAAVEAGAVLADLRALAVDGRLAGLLPGVASVVLTRSYRYRAEGALGLLVGAIRAGDAQAAVEAASTNDPAVTWIDSEDRDPRELRRMIAARLRESWPQGEAQPRRVVLAAGYDGWLGVNAINEEVRHACGAGAADYVDGQPVLITANDAASGLANGDLGRIEREGNAWSARFGAGSDARVLASGQMPAHRDAWAMTVHKAQGSEFDEVIIVLPDERHPLAMREWLYTAVSRARAAVRLVGSRQALEQAVGRAGTRRTALAARLASNAGRAV